VDYKIKRDLADYTDGQRLPGEVLRWFARLSAEYVLAEVLFVRFSKCNGYHVREYLGVLLTKFAN
jgi:hypothetical protein